MKIFRITFLFFFSLILFFGGTNFILADVTTGLSVTIGSNGDIPSVSIACTPTHNYTLALIHRTGDFANHALGVVERKYCANGVVTFGGLNLNEKLIAVIGESVWWTWIHTPLEYIIKDTTGIDVGQSTVCDENQCQLFNLDGAFNNFDKSVYVASSTYWATAAAGPIFDTTDNLTWFNVANGDGTVNYIASSTPPELTGNSSVLFLPGFQGSRLYKARLINCAIDCEDTLWEPNAPSDVEALYMDQSGESVDDSIYTRDVLDEAYSVLNIYKSFLEKLDEMKTEEDIGDFSAIPYDWRLPLDDLLMSGKKEGENISYLQATSSPYILQELTRLAGSSQNGKVTIVAHSNGGLLAKALLRQLADVGDPLLAKVDKLILVAVPQLGTPSAVTSLLHGYDQGIPFTMGPFLSSRGAREFGHNVPSAYNFLPSGEYFDHVDTPMVTFDDSMEEWISRYSEVVDSEDEMDTFLTDSFGRVASDSSDTKTPTSLLSNLLSDAQVQHATLDNWTPPAGMEVVDIAGWGIPSTVSGLKYSLHKGKVKLEPTFTIDGDGTVVIPSALYTNGNASTTRYWVDLETHNEDHSKRKHHNIFEVQNLIDFIEDVVSTTSLISLPQYISTSAPSDTRDRLIYSLHSPLTLDIYDSLGNHTGISTTTGQIEEQIPGTYFIQFGEEKYIFTDTGTPVHITMSGYDSGTFTFTIQQVQGDAIVSTVTFEDLPTIPTTQVSITVGSDITTLSSLVIDSDNNGSADITLDPVIGSVVTYIPPAPVVVPVPSESSGSNGMPMRNAPDLISATTPLLPIQPATSTLATTSEPVLQVKVPTPTVIQVKPVAPKKPIAVIKENKSQTAQLISSSPQTISRITAFWKKTVNWFVSVFKGK